MGVYVFRNNQVEGPFDELVIQQALANGTMSPGEQVCREGSEEWVPIARFFHLPLSPTVQPSIHSQFFSWFSRISQHSKINVGLVVLGAITILSIGLICISTAFTSASNLGVTGVKPVKSTLQEDIAKLEQNITEEDQYLVKIDQERSHLNTNTEHRMSYAFDLAAMTIKVEDQQKKDKAALQELYRLRDRGVP